MIIPSKNATIVNLLENADMCWVAYEKNMPSDGYLEDQWTIPTWMATYTYGTNITHWPLTTA